MSARSVDSSVMEKRHRAAGNALDAGIETILNKRDHGLVGWTFTNKGYEVLAMLKVVSEDGTRYVAFASSETLTGAVLKMKGRLDNEEWTVVLKRDAWAMGEGK